MKTIRSELLNIALAFTVLVGLTSSASACYTIVVGREASADGYVIMAHNEDDGPPQIVNHRKVPRVQYALGEKYKLLGGGELDQVPETWAYIWSEMPGLLFSDSYLNEWGVCVASNNCPSREDNPELTAGGISYDLRRLVAQRARTAREGVLLAGSLVERFGYDASGRTYIICDPDEGWLFCAVNGKHWLAARVPDDQVALVANTYSVHEVNLQDTLNFLASPDIAKYAQKRGWFTPKKGQAFDFAAAYAHPETVVDSSNFCRQWGGLRYVAAQNIPLSSRLPLAVVPRQKLGVPAVKEILRDHYEWSELYRTWKDSGSPHQTQVNTICNWTTQTSFIAQLRGDLPPEIGLVYWVALAPPCASLYVPFYFGLEAFPTGYDLGGGSPTPEYFWEQVEASFQPEAFAAFWTFSNFHYKVEGNYGKVIDEFQKKAQIWERQAESLQPAIEEAAVQLYPQDRPAARELLANYSLGLYLQALEAMQEILNQPSN